MLAYVFNLQSVVNLLTVACLNNDIVYIVYVFSWFFLNISLKKFCKKFMNGKLIINSVYH